MRKTIGVIILFLTLLTSALGSYLYFTKYDLQIFFSRFASRISLNKELTSPFIASPTPKILPLEKYSISNLKNYPFQTNEITLIELVNENEEFSTYLFSYKTMDKTMTGSAHIPSQLATDQKSFPVIIMVRGYATPDQYYPGFGTKNAAEVFAKNGYITLAPDFFGFGNSDPEPEDSWEARFIKPINVLELIKTIQKSPKISFSIPDQMNDNQPEINLNPKKIGMWGHSNGGQISISVLQALSESIPTTVWAPVTAPFPYSILYFTATNEDEGKEARKWLAMFEDDYDVFEFSITQHLKKLTSPLQIHHGGRDKDALQEWSDNFATKLEQENQRRKKLNNEEPTKLSANLEAQQNLDEKTENISTINFTKPIDFYYFIYPQADHNLQPAENWQKAINRDLEFFKKYL